MKQIIKQPNGLYCVFSTIVDNVTDINCTEEEVLDIFRFYGYSEIEKAKKNILKLESGEKPYGKYTMSFSEMMALITETHGKEESENILSLTR